MTASTGARILLGGFAGTGRGAQDFEDSATRAQADAAIAGIYGGYRHGSFYGNAIVKYEHQWVAMSNLATAGGDAPFDVDLLGASLESGFHFTSKSFYARPRMRLNYAHAWASSFEDASGVTIDLKNADMLTGEVAARLGASAGTNELYIEGGMRNEFLGETRAEVSDLVFSDALPGTIAFASAGATIGMMHDVLSLSLNAGYAKGQSAEELNATLALRLDY
jgi:outer membrane autotransporter protein